MNLIPKSVSRLNGRTMLKLKAGSPTILVVSGVVGLGVTAVMAARATRRVDPILDQHKQARASIGYVGSEKGRQTDLVRLYTHTGLEMTKLYGPTILLGTTSAVAVLGGHKILRGRHLATMAAYSGLADQFNAYRKRIIATLGEDVERGIFEGARGEWEEDPDHKGEYKLTPKYDQEVGDYLRPWFDETNVHWTRDPVANYLFLKGVQTHMNNMLQIRGHVMLSDVYDALRIERRPESIVMGWLWHGKDGDSLVDFGFMDSNDPNTIAFREGRTRNVRLNFNVDDKPIWDKI